jgi:hypothetical protein
MSTQVEISLFSSPAVLGEEAGLGAPGLFLQRGVAVKVEATYQD